MNRNIFIGLFLYLIIWAGNSNAQDRVIEKLDSSFTNYQQSHIKEKIFIHTDKEAYMTTENIWFKIYCVDGISNRPLDLSKVVYTEIYDSNNKPVQRAKISLSNGFGIGSFYIPPGISTGNYKLVGYTNWMKNFDEKYYFEKQIIIINTQSDKSVNQEVQNRPIIQFFPEGGSFIEGINSKVACKVVGNDGKGLDFKAVILKNKTDTIAKFSAFKFGIGTFNMIPDGSSHYECVVSLGGKKIMSVLPSINTRGYSMQIIDTVAEKIGINIESKNLEDEEIYLIVHDKQLIRHAKHLKTNKGHALFSIDKALLSQGISNFTLFNSSGQPVCGRLYFKPVTDVLHIDVQSDSVSYGVRSKVSLDIQSKDKNGPQTANSSLSVYKTDEIQLDGSMHILSYFWLKSELKDEIESPDYYFGKPGAELISAADNLMLTSGWRKYLWDDALKAGKPILKFIPEHEGHLVAGRLTDKNGGPVNNRNVFFSIPGIQPKLFNANTKYDGSFVINVRDYYGTNEVVLQSDASIDTSSVISLSNPFSESYKIKNTPPLNIKKLNVNDLNSWNLNAQVQNAYYGNKLRQTFNHDSDTTSFYINYTKRYLMDDYVRFPTMREVFREFISQAYMVRKDGDIQLRIGTANGLLSINPMIILNGVPVFSVKKLMDINPAQVKAMEIVNRRYFMNNRMEEGIINITTNTKDMAGYEIEANALILDYEGLQLKTQFYAPVYDNKRQIESKMPDFRTVLEWAPELITDRTGNKKWAFYTSDQPGNYIGIIQGITNKGEAGYTTFKFDVRN
ncbi:MAG: hypothetical protein P0Y49_21415 [Candidatus Pedobacter colombiensis]|uniref:MG2 domain protein n=1 Tax=Candidatus Pedobacter colombiensis TaxID=3121371 RepID=A0AAJ6B8N8_9SPHI|nr:hypothetical protein [Pedobacter sp.]WEK19338.1 MAG: hypothetical protein P0Y49_21415 [Pedobacter sp.]